MPRGCRFINLMARASLVIPLLPRDSLSNILMPRGSSFINLMPCASLVIPLMPRDRLFVFVMLILCSNHSDKEDGGNCRNLWWRTSGSEGICRRMGWTAVIEGCPWGSGEPQGSLVVNQQQGRDLPTHGPAFNYFPTKLGLDLDLRTATITY